MNYNEPYQEQQGAPVANQGAPRQEPPRAASGAAIGVLGAGALIVDDHGGRGTNVGSGRADNVRDLRAFKTGRGGAYVCDIDDRRHIKLAQLYPYGITLHPRAILTRNELARIIELYTRTYPYYCVPPTSCDVAHFEGVRAANRLRKEGWTISHTTTADVMRQFGIAGA
jgi:hypothetical protein